MEPQNTDQLDLLPDTPPPPSPEAAEQDLPKSDYESAYERIVNAHRKSRGLTDTFDTRKGVIPEETTEEAEPAVEAEPEQVAEDGDTPVVAEEPAPEEQVIEEESPDEESESIVAAEEDVDPEPAQAATPESVDRDPPPVRYETRAAPDEQDSTFNPVKTRLEIRQAYDEDDIEKAMALEEAMDQYRIREAKKQLRQDNEQQEYTEMATYYIEKYPFLSETGDPAKYEPVNALASGFIGQGMAPAAALKRAVETMEPTWRPQEVVPQEKIERQRKMESRKERKRQTVVQIPTATARGAAPPEQKPMSNQEFIAFMRNQRTGSR